jgi:hypothetical protein
VDAKLVDELVPGPTRTPAQMQDSDEAIRVEPVKSDLTAPAASRAAQTTEISADVFARLLEDGANPPGVLDEQVREGTWWPEVPTNSHYMRHGDPAGGGNLDGALGLRRRKGALQLHVEYSGMPWHEQRVSSREHQVGRGRAPGRSRARVLHPGFSHGRHGKISGRRGRSWQRDGERWRNFKGSRGGSKGDD